MWPGCLILCISKAFRLSTCPALISQGLAWNCSALVVAHFSFIAGNCSVWTALCFPPCRSQRTWTGWFACHPSWKPTLLLLKGSKNMLKWRRRYSELSTGLWKPVPCSEVSAAPWVVGGWVCALSWGVGQSSGLWVPARDRLGLSGKFLFAFGVFPLGFTQCYLANVLLCWRLSSRVAQMFWFPKTSNIVFMCFSFCTQCGE